MQCHNHRPQINQWYRREEIHNNNGHTTVHKVSEYSKVMPQSPTQTNPYDREEEIDNTNGHATVHKVSEYSKVMPQSPTQTNPYDREEEIDNANGHTRVHKVSEYSKAMSKITDHRPTHGTAKKKYITLSATRQYTK